MKQKTAGADDTSAVMESPETQTANSTKPSIEGFYAGGFEAEKENYDNDNVPMTTNKINLSVDSFKDGKIYGHSVVAGNIRPFKGSYSVKEGTYEVEAKEPGDDQYDGMFSFSIDTQNERIKGKWFANNKKLAVPERSYYLSKATFSYDPGQELGNEDVRVFNVTGMEPESHEHITQDAGKINASTTLLKKEDIQNMYKRDLEVMRNAIYARHGYSFKNREMRDFFDKNVSWYIPVSTDVSKELTELEKTNIALLKRYEKHAEAYYDDFGR
jgi:hypothetical protein